MCKPLNIHGTLNFLSQVPLLLLIAVVILKKETSGKGVFQLPVPGCREIALAETWDNRSCYIHNASREQWINAHMHIFLARVLYFCTGLDLIQKMTTPRVGGPFLFCYLNRENLHKHVCRITYDLEDSLLRAASW